jgi:hypothetical protein
METRNRHKKSISRGIWIAGNMLLAVKYYFDKASIQCEPCINKDCPPCQTDFMEYIWYYVLAWNVFYLLIELITKKRNWNKWWTRKT